MPRRKAREEISSELAAEVLFRSDRICCVCRTKGKPVQIHHIDENPSHNVFKNLAVLCFDCHTETQIRGGFHRKLDAEQVILYRDDWLIKVAIEHASAPEYHSELGGIPLETNLEIATSVAEIYRERKEYLLLAMHYSSIKNIELRDKYIDLIIQQGVSDHMLIELRGIQDKMNLVPQEMVDRRIQEYQHNKDWTQLGRFYRSLGKHELAVMVTCQGIAESIQEGNAFSAAFYLKELQELNAVEHLFTTALIQARQQNDLWWQYRALCELGWTSEIKEFLLSHQAEIDGSNDIFLQLDLASVSGDMQRYAELHKEMARTMSLIFDDGSDDEKK